MDNKRLEAIDLILVLKILLEKKKQVIVCCLVTTILGLLYPMTKPPIYTSSAMVYKCVNKQIGNVSDSNLIEENGIDINSYIELMRLPKIIDSAVNKIQTNDDQEKAQIHRLLSNGLKVELIRNTGLISIKANGRTPKEAQQLTQGVIESYIEYIRDNKNILLARESEFLEKEVTKAKDEVIEVNNQLLVTPKDESNETYRQLKLDAKVREEIYDRMVKEWKTAQVRQQQPLEEIQVVSPASLPTSEGGPRSERGKYVLIGLAVGILMSFGYVFLLYKQKLNK